MEVRRKNHPNPTITTKTTPHSRHIDKPTTVRIYRDVYFHDQKGHWNGFRLEFIYKLDVKTKLCELAMAKKKRYARVKKILLT